jgi:hypothetical protein
LEGITCWPLLPPPEDPLSPPEEHEKVSADKLKRMLRIKNRELFFMLKKEKEVDLFIIYLLCY